jgi:hypothetical protein
MMGGMVLTQSDFRTVRVHKNGVDFFIRYSLIWNGEERLPESISARKDHVTAYFLTATIRDSFGEDAQGLRLERFWEVLPAGKLLLGFCFDFPGWSDSAYLLPGAAAGETLGREIITCPGDLTSLPSAVILYSEPHCLFLFADLPATERQFGRIELERISEDAEEPALRLRLLFPWHPRSGSLQPIVSPGEFQGGLRLRLVTAPREKIYALGLAAQRVSAPRPRDPSAPADAAALEKVPAGIPRALEACLSTHLICQDGLVALQARQAQPWLSMSAGAGMALLLAELRPGQEEKIELALQLADTVLCAQHPGGLFYERYHLKKKQWLAPDRSGNLPVTCSLRIASSLLRLAARLEAAGMRAEKYLLAAGRTVDIFLDHRKRLSALGSRFSLDTLLPRGSGEEVLELADPLALLFHRTRKDHYRKALGLLQQQALSSPPRLAPPAAEEATAALRLAQTAATLRQAGLRVEGLPAYLAQLLPWIYLNRTGREEKIDLGGSIRAGLGKPGLIFRGWEWAYSLHTLNNLLAPTQRVPEIDNLIARLLSSSARQPLGCSGWQPDLGYAAVDARILIREAWFCLRLRGNSVQAS